MPWDRTTRKDYKRDGRRYESDVTDPLVESMLPRDAAPSRDGLTRGLQCHPVCAGHGMPVAGVAEGFSALFDGHQLLLQVARQRCDRMIDALRGTGPGRKIEPTAAIIRAGGPRL